MKRSHNVSQEQHELFARIVECSSDAIFSVDRGVITAWNSSAERLYGYTAQEVVGQRFIPLLWPSAVADEATLLYERLSTEERVIDIETDHRRKDGEPIPVSLTLSLLTDASGTPMGAAITVRTISEGDPLQGLGDDMADIKAFARHTAWRMEEMECLGRQLERLEVVDGNTGLTNRRALDRELDKECRRAARYCMPLSFLMLYIDNFRHYQETCGLLASEAILRRIALLLQEEARTTDLVACYEEELFCIVLPHTGREGALVAAERIRAHVAEIYGPENPITVSTGAATFSHAMESGMELIAEAERALALAKQDGCNRIVHYEATQDFARFPTENALEPTGDAASIGAAGQVVTRMGNTSFLNVSRKELAQAYDSTIEGWSRMLDLRDKETVGHSQRVTEMTVCLAQIMGITGQELVYMRWGALLHDIGKLGVPDNILLKPGPLTPTEWTIMRSHTTLAYTVLDAIDFLHPALDIPFSHHERWDGTGYPQGLHGEEIPLAARIFAIVDVWDALRSDRPYRSAWSERQALEYIYSLSGKHFDPMVVRAFHQMMRANNIGNEVEPVYLAA